MSIKVTKHTILLCNFCGTGQEYEVDGKDWLELRSMTKRKGKHSWEGALSVQAISWVIDHSKHKGNTFVVLLMIANHAKSDGTGAWPSVQTLCKESRLSRRTVQRCVKRLSRKWSGIKGWQDCDAELMVRIGKGPYGSNLYDIPSVRLTQGGRQIVAGTASDSDAGGAPQVTPNPSLTVPKDKEEILNLDEQLKETDRQMKAKRKTAHNLAKFPPAVYR